MTGNRRKRYWIGVWIFCAGAATLIALRGPLWVWSLGIALLLAGWWQVRGAEDEG